MSRQASGTLEELPELVSKERNFVWVDLTGYTPEEMRAVAHVVGLHRIGVQAALALWQRPRLDLFDSHFFVTATVPALNRRPIVWRRGGLVSLSDTIFSSARTGRHCHS